MYALVLLTATIVTLIGLSALSLSRLQAKRSAIGHDWMAAQMIAQSGLEFGMGRIEGFLVQAEAANRNWRDDLGPSFQSGIKTLGDGTFRWTAVDETGDNDITNNDTDPVRVSAIASVRTTSYTLSVIYAPGPSDSPVDSLQSLMHADGDVTINGTVNGTGLMSANGNITANAARVYLDVAAAGIVSGGAYLGDDTDGEVSREVPASSVFDYYLRNGTTIDIGDLYSWGGYEIDDVVLSPGTNPYGPENELGIYVIDCEGRDLTITDSRIVGTIVLLNPGSASVVLGEIVAEPAAPNFPVFLIDGSMRFDFDSTAPLAEAYWRNYNPASTPYQGLSDSDTSDEFPTQIKGLIYVSGNVTLDSQPTFFGSIIAGGNIVANGTVSMIENTAFLDDTPPGFKATTGGRMAPVPGSVERVVN